MKIVNEMLAAVRKALQLPENYYDLPEDTYEKWNRVNWDFVEADCYAVIRDNYASEELYYKEFNRACDEWLETNRKEKV